MIDNKGHVQKILNAVLQLVIDLELELTEHGHFYDILLVLFGVPEFFYLHCEFKYTKADDVNKLKIDFIRKRMKEINSNL